MDALSILERMLSFACGHCGHLVFFENSVCLNCSTALGFVSENLEMVALEGAQARDRHRCANLELARCNWLVTEPDRLCRSCELTRTRPNDADRAGLAAFASAEAAKRRVIMQLLDLGMPGVAPGELAFDLLSSEHEPVATGHADGVITIDLAESDDARRERRRTELGEPYRTMLGHLRHELGHYFQPLVVNDDDDWSRLPGAVRRRAFRLRPGAGAPLRRRAAWRLGAAPRQRIRDDAPVGGLGRDVRPLPPHP